MVYVMAGGWVKERLATRGEKICWDPHTQGFLSLETAMGERRQGEEYGGLCPIQKWCTPTGTPGPICQVLPLLQKQPGAEGAASGGWGLTQLAMVT